MRQHRMPRRGSSLGLILKLPNHLQLATASLALRRPDGVAAEVTDVGPAFRVHLDTVNVWALLALSKW